MSWPYLCASAVCHSPLDSPFSFKRRLWYISYRYHLLSWSDPHYRTVVALCGTHQPQTGKRSPWKSPLEPDRQGGKEGGGKVKTQGNKNQSIAFLVGTQFIKCFIYLVCRNCSPGKTCHWHPGWFGGCWIWAKAVHKQETPEDVRLLIFSVRRHSSAAWAGDLKSQHRTTNRRRACHSCI